MLKTTNWLVAAEFETLSFINTLRRELIISEVEAVEIWCVCQAVLRFAGAVDERISSKSNGIGRVLDPVKRTHNKFWKIFVWSNDTNHLGRKI